MSGDIKKSVIESIASSRNWRRYLAEMEPANERNRESEIALAELAAYIDSLPDNHALFNAIKEVAVDHLGGLFFKNDSFRNWWYERLNCYGYDCIEDHSNFAQEVIDLQAGTIM